MGSRRVKVVSGAQLGEPKKKKTKAAKAAKEPVAKEPEGLPAGGKEAALPAEKPAAKKPAKKATRSRKKEEQVKRGKKYLAARGKVESGKVYSLPEAIKLVKETSSAGFDASVEAHINLGLDLGKQEQKIRTTVALPHGTGKVLRVLVFTEGKEAKAALDAGADAVGDEQMLAKIAAEGKVDFDAIVATPTFMPKLAQVARVLGPKGLMPSPKSGTVSEEPAKVVAELKKGRVELKTEVQPIVHVVIGKVSFSDKALEENLRAILDALGRAKPSGVRGEYIKSVYLKSTMGPSVRVAI